MNISLKLDKKQIFLLILIILTIILIFTLIYLIFIPGGPYGAIKISELNISEVQDSDVIYLTEQDFHNFPALDSLIRKHRPGYVNLDQDQYYAYGEQFGGKILEYEGKYYDLHFIIV
jgi:hypothetical protein